VATGLDLGVNQCIVDDHLEHASMRWDQGEAFDLGFEIIEQVICQAYSPVGIVSDSAVGDRDL
jgi:hypothetical protein